MASETKLHLGQRALWRVELLVIIILIPTAIIFWLVYTQQRRTIISSAHNQAASNLELAVDQQIQLKEDAHKTLIAVALSQDISNRQTCINYLAAIKAKNHSFANLGVIDVPSGQLRCDALGSAPGLALSDRLYYKKALETQDFAAGEYQIGRLTRKPGINFGYPVLDHKSVTAVVYAAVDLSQLGQKLADFVQPGEALTVFDHNGVVLARQPASTEWVGKSIKDSELYKTVTAAGQGRADIKGIDGVDRTYNFQTIHSTPPVYMSAGVPTSQLLRSADKTFRQAVASLLLILLLATIAAWVLGKLLIISYVNAVNKTKDEFLQLATHQLQNPVSGVKFNLAMLLQGMAGKLPDSQKDIIQQAYDANEHERIIVNDLLNVARLESGRLKLAIKPADIVAVAHQSLSEHQAIIQSRSQTIKSQLPQSLVIPVDADRLRMVIDNIISNASKYTPNAGVIEVSITASDKAAEVRIKDNGVGINQQDIDKLFKKFSRIDNPLSKQRGGTGLGLYLAKKIVELHGGAIDVESVPKQGTAFIIQLPIAALPAPPA